MKNEHFLNLDLLIKQCKYIFGSKNSYLNLNCKYLYIKTAICVSQHMLVLKTTSQTSLTCLIGTPYERKEMRATLPEN